jgi:antitoxin component of MazEF toxin-antitoxin module
MANTRIIIEPSSRARTAELAAEPADATASVSAAEPKAAEPKAE